nr:LysR family transcriptional regulator [Parapusillimonas granuli]
MNESQLIESAIFKDFTSLRIFVRSVETGSFSEVARRIGVTPAMVSKRIAFVEKSIGQRLFNRDTRRLMVTEAGERLYDHCMRALKELDEAAEELSALKDEPSGCLRMTVPAMLGREFIAPKLPRLLVENPKLTLDVNFSMATIDLYAARVDLAVRIADSIDPGLIAVRLAPYRRVFCATPAYLEKRGVPNEPADLRAHNCLVTSGSTVNTRWPVLVDGQVTQVHIQGNFVADHGLAVRYACLEGLGIMMGARWMVEKDLQEGRLTEVLSDYLPHNRAVYAVLLNRSDESAKLKVGVDFLKRCFAEMN